ncbi:MAG: YfhO family protein [Candidatus Eremiobacteraeota bacterium]|nr:YfhO family protein [Candidatus Eremiobacteraeota bacterium]
MSTAQRVVDWCRRHPALFSLLFSLGLALALMHKLLLGQTYLPSDVLLDYPLWYDWVSHPKNFDLFDVIILFYPHDLVYHQQLHQGHLFFWNPYNYLGHPVFADGKSAMLYPIRVLLNLVLSTHRAHDCYLLGHLTLLGVTTSWLLRRLRLSLFAASVGASTWMLSGFVMGWLEHEHAVTFSAWLPLVLGLLHQGFEERRPARLMVASLVLALLGFAGSVQLVAYVLLFSGFWGLYWWWQCGHRPALLLWFAAAMALPLPLAGVQLIPTMELVARCSRPPAHLEVLTAAYQQLLLGLPASLLGPDFMGNPVDGFALRRIWAGNYWTYSETYAYVGVMPLLLAGLGWSSRQDKAWRFFAGALVLLVIVPASPLWAIPFHLLPGFQQTMPTRLLMFIDFCLAVLAAYGAHDVAAGKARGMGSMALVAGGLCLAWLGALQYVVAHLRPFLEWMVRSGAVRLPDQDLAGANWVPAVVSAASAFYSWHNPVLWLPALWLMLAAVVLVCWSRSLFSRRLLMLVTLLLVAADPLYYAVRFNVANPVETLYPPTPASSFLQAQPGFHRVMGLGTLKPNTGMPYGLHAVGGVDSLFPEQISRFVSTLELGPGVPRRKVFNNQLFPISNAHSPLIDLAGVKYLLTYPNPNLPPDYRLRYGRYLQVWENPDALPIVWSAPRAVPVQDFETALDQLNRQGLDYRQQVLVEGLPAEEAVSTFAVDLEEWSPGLMRCRVEAPAGGWLVFSETHYPGWKAYLDGQPLPVYPANALFMATRLPEGTKGTVEFRFEPDSFRRGLVVSTVAALAWLVLLVLALRLTNRIGEPGSAQAGVAG